MSDSAEAVELLSVEDLLEIAAGVLPVVELRDPGLLASAAARPATRVFGQDAYADLVTKAAALMHSLARNPPLVDGNKRLAWAGMRATLLLNGEDLTHDIDEAEAFVLALAAGEIDVADAATWIRARLSG